MNLKKTKVLHQPPPDTSVSPPTITIDSERLENWRFSKLPKRVFENPDLLAKTKLLVYKAVILPTLIYGAKAWTTYSRHLRTLESYHQRCLQKILRVSWEDKRPNASILQEANTDSITTTISKHQLRWTGHVIQMPDTHLPKQVLYSELSTDQLAPGGQKKRYKDNIKTNLKKFNIQSSNWEVTASQRRAWRNCLHKGATFHEDHLQQAARIKQQQRRERLSTKQAPTHPTTSTQHPCPRCKKVCGSRIGLFSHLKTHNKDTKGCRWYSTLSDR
ncbi:hypothetical protein ABVT39_008105 [Epinephelus coioides]